MKEKTKQFLVLGLGRFGESVAKALSELGHEVLAIDRKQDLVDEVAPFVTQAAQLDATDEAALESLGVRNFDAAIVSVGQNMRDSILICLQLKELGIPMLIAKAMDDLHAKVLTKVGVDRVVFPEREMGARLAKSLDAPNVLDLIDVSKDEQIAEIVLPAKWEGDTIVGLNVRRKYGVSILAIQRGGQFIVSPTADTRLEAGDLLLVLGKRVDVEIIEKL